MKFTHSNTCIIDMLCVKYNQNMSDDSKDSCKASVRSKLIKQL
jgi:hypothetical protein